MWWWLGCSLPNIENEELAADHLALQAEVGALDQRFGAVTSRLGSLETDVERRLADVEAKIEALAEAKAAEEVAAGPAALTAWSGRWVVRSELSANYGCAGGDEPDSFRWSIIEHTPGKLTLLIEGGETRFRQHTIAIEPTTGALTAMQSIGRDTSSIIVQRKGDTFTGYRTFNNVGNNNTDNSSTCAKIWRLVGQRG